MNTFLGTICLRKKRQSFSSQNHLQLRNMSKTEKFIQEHTRNCSNEVDGWVDGKYSPFYQPWLTPDQARRAVEIAKEELIEWIAENIGEYCDGENIMFSATHMENIDIFEQERFINDLKQAMKDE